jgi:hypothetical protein
MEITFIAPMTTVEIILPMERRLQPAWKNPPPRKVPAKAGAP